MHVVGAEGVRVAGDLIEPVGEWHAVAPTEGTMLCVERSPAWTFPGLSWTTASEHACSRCVEVVESAAALIPAPAPEPYPIDAAPAMAPEAPLMTEALAPQDTGTS